MVPYLCSEGSFSRQVFAQLRLTIANVNGPVLFSFVHFPLSALAFDQDEGGARNSFDAGLDRVSFLLALRGHEREETTMYDLEQGWGPFRVFLSADRLFWGANSVQNVKATLSPGSALPKTHSLYTDSKFSRLAQRGGAFKKRLHGLTSIP